MGGLVWCGNGDVGCIQVFVCGLYQCQCIRGIVVDVDGVEGDGDVVVFDCLYYVFVICLQYFGCDLGWIECIDVVGEDDGVVVVVIVVGIEFVDYCLLQFLCYVLDC